MDKDLIKISPVTEIVEILNRFNGYFPRSIENRVGNLFPYATKLAEHAFIYVSKDNGVISGVVIFFANDLLTKIAYLSHIAVSVEHQNKGIGSLLLKFSCELSKQYGMTAIKLEVDNSNYKAIAHYEKYGFRFVGNASSESQYMIKELI